MSKVFAKSGHTVKGLRIRALNCDAHLFVLGDVLAEDRVEPLRLVQYDRTEIRVFRIQAFVVLGRERRASAFQYLPIPNT